MNKAGLNYTDMLGNVMSGLSVNFSYMHTREEAQNLIGKMTHRANENFKSKPYNPDIRIFDASVAERNDKLMVLLDECIADYRSNQNCDLAVQIENLKNTLPEINNTKKSFDDYTKGCQKIADLIPSINELDGEFFRKLNAESEKFKSSEDYIRRLVLNRLEVISPEFIAETDANGNVKKDSDGNIVLKAELPSTRLLILKQFIKQFGWCEDTETAGGSKDKKSKGYNCFLINEICKSKFNSDFEKMAREIDEGIFDLLGYRTNKKEKADTRLKEFGVNLKNGTFNKNVRIIYTADTLARAWFDDSGSTLISLYIFAIAFEMTISFERTKSLTKDDPEYYTDIRKNLIFDYYCDNLVNNIGTTKEEKSNAEKYVSGYGINVKNYAEIIFIYFLRKEDLTPLEKLQKATKMITRCSQSDEAKSIDDIEEYADSEDSDEVSKRFMPTEIFIQTLVSNVLSLKEKDFEKYILENYECVDIDPYYGSVVHTNAARKASSHITADKIYKEIAYDTKESLNADVLPESINYPVLSDIIEGFNKLAKKEKTLRNLVKGDDNYHLDAVTETDKDLIGTTGFLVTRYDLLFAFSDYIAGNTNFSLDVNREALLSYEKFYNFFRNDCKVDNTLIECGFQEIISKNVFDLLLVFITYKKCIVKMKGIAKKKGTDKNN